MDSRFRRNDGQRAQFAIPRQPDISYAQIVIPAKAGDYGKHPWIPAFAGMTDNAPNSPFRAQPIIPPNAKTYISEPARRGGRANSTNTAAAPPRMAKATKANT